MTFSVSRVLRRTWRIIQWIHHLNQLPPRTPGQRAAFLPTAKRLLIESAYRARRWRAQQRTVWALLDCATRISPGGIRPEWSRQTLDRYRARHRLYEHRAEKAATYHLFLYELLHNEGVVDPSWDPDPRIFLRALKKSRGASLRRASRARRNQNTIP